MRSALSLLFLALPLLGQEKEEEIPPGPLNELMEGLERGDKEITIDIHQSRLDGIEHWLGKEREKGIRDLQEFLAELAPVANAAEPALGAATAYNDAITLARRHKVTEVKESYVTGAAATECGLLEFRLPASARWSYKAEKGARGLISQRDRKGNEIRTFAIRFYPKELPKFLGDKSYDGSNALKLAQEGMAAAADSLAKVTKRSGVFKKALSEDFKTASCFLVEGQAADGTFLRCRSYYFRVTDDCCMSVTVRDFVRDDGDPEEAAVLATFRRRFDKR